MTFKSIFNILGLALACSVVASPTLADTYPSKPVKIIVPYGTGGGSDTLARQLGISLQQMWGQGVSVDNRAGASGNIGSEAVVRSPADGYTLMLQNSTMVANMGLGVKLNYDPEKDLTPIMLLGITPIALVAHPSLNIKTLKQLQDYAKANPGKLSYGSCGIGTPMHFVMELVKQKTGLDAVHAGQGLRASTDRRGGRADSTGVAQCQPSGSVCQGGQAQCGWCGQPKALRVNARRSNDGRARHQTAGPVYLVRADGASQHASGCGGQNHCRRTQGAG